MTKLDKLKELQTKHAHAIFDSCSGSAELIEEIAQKQKESSTAEYREIFLQFVDGNERVKSELEQSGNSTFTDNNGKLWKLDEWLDQQCAGYYEATIDMARGLFLA